MSVKCFLRSTYGPRITSLISRYERNKEKTARFKNHLVFNLHCKTERILPKSLEIRPPINTSRGWDIARHASHQFLNERIQLSTFKLKQLEDERKWLELGLHRNVSEGDFLKIEKTTNEKAEFEFVTTKERHCRKLQKLIDENRQPAYDSKMQEQDNDKKKWVINLSSKVRLEDFSFSLQKLKSC